MSFALAAGSPTGSIDREIEGVLHDMRGYLTIIRGQCHGVVRDGRASGATIERLRIIDAEVDRITHAIERTRDLLVDANRGPRHVELVDLDNLTASAIDRIDGAAQARQVSINTARAAHGATIVGHRTDLERVLDNLLLNAIVATDKCGVVDVGITQVGEELHLTVGNDVASGEQDTSGWGIGLQIVREIVARNGGRMISRGTGDRASVVLAFAAGRPA